MHLNFTYPCGCAATRMRGNESFTLSAVCREHGGEDSLSSMAARGAGSEGTAAPQPKLHSMNMYGVCRDCGADPYNAQRPISEICTPAQAESLLPYISSFAVPNLRVPQAPREPADYFAPLRAVLAKWENNPDDLETMDEGMKILRGFLAAPVTQRVTDEAGIRSVVNKEWRNCLREALKECALTPETMELPTAGANWFALVGVIQHVIYYGTKLGREEIMRELTKFVVSQAIGQQTGLPK